MSNIIKQNPIINSPTKEIIVISFDEESKDYNLKMITDNTDFCNNVIAHKYVVLCTQKSKSSSLRTQTGISTNLFSTNPFSAKHFAHIFSDFMKDTGYILVQKYDSSPMFSAEFTENISLRTRIYRKKDDSNPIINVKFSEIKNGSFRNYFRNTYNNSALLTTFNINNKIYNIVNTDLFSLKRHHRQMYNDGLFYKQQQFLAIIKDFKLYDKYANNQNIIIAGSLKFNIYPLKMTNILSEENMKEVNLEIKILKNKLNSKTENNKQKILNKLKEYNELNKYLNQLIKYYNTTPPKLIYNINNIIYSKNTKSSLGTVTGINKNTVSVGNIKYQKNKITKNIPSSTFPIKKINNIIKKYDKEHENIKNLLDEFRKNLKMNITNISIHENNYTGTISSFNPFIAKSQRIFESASRRLSPSVKKTAASISKKTEANFSYQEPENILGKKLLKNSLIKKSSSNNTSIGYHTRSSMTPTAKERILYALTNNQDINYNIYDYVNSKNIRVYKNKLVTLSIPNAVEQFPRNS